ncbi:mRNA export factor [Thalictrum thalictroides]|uniref:mRNA export factor n=1 Tax=Thalictrum thalictroides TaxID=46969 RepID=A0A7J6WS30_THATH|nr:mRNA export factor [Thalictrum thalictroides]
MLISLHNVIDSRYWDTRQQTPVHTQQLPERCYALSVRHPLMVVGTADRNLIVFNLQNPQTEFRRVVSPLKYQTRCVAAFPDQQGFLVGSIEGRVGVQHLDDAHKNKDFTFKCHREGNEIYSVNSLNFHPVHHTFATSGSDGAFNFWDKDSKQRLKAMSRCNQPIPCSTFNNDGSIFAYAVSYDWSKGAENHNPATAKNYIYLHLPQETEVKGKPRIGASGRKNNAFHQFQISFEEVKSGKIHPLYRVNSRRTLVRASQWTDEKSPYDTLELERDADDEKIKFAYRRLAKFYHPDVYNGRGTLEEGETAESRFIKIQAAYELLIDYEKRKKYDTEHRVNPMKASQAWMEWFMKKRKAFDQRGDMAIAAWAEQQQREMNIRARRLSHSKVDPEEEKRILAREKKASMEYFNNTLKRHTLVLKKRDLMRKKAEEDKKKVISQLLAAEGLELDTDDEESL